MSSGLEGVVVADTRLSLVDGSKGELTIAGRPLHELVKLKLEEIPAILWGKPANLGEARLSAWNSLKPNLGQLKGLEPKQACRLGLALLSDNVSRTEITASFPVILAATAQGADTPEPRPELSHGEDLFRMMEGSLPTKARARALETYLMTVCEHGMNASTFTCRVVASTGATPLESVIAAFSALCGPLHGGAPGPVLDLLDELSDEPDHQAALQRKLNSGERLMGFGHRVYKARDPRADVLQQAVDTLAGSDSLQHAKNVEKAALDVLARHKPDRPLFTNVEFYTAVLLHELGFDRSWFTPLFATGRVLGWMAHDAEQRANGRLMRPKARYVGPELVLRQPSIDETLVC